MRAEPGPEPRPDPFVAVAEAVAGEIGHGFLSRLVGVLRDHMAASLAVITVPEGDPPAAARAIWALEDGQPVHDMVYPLEDEPCGLVYARGERLVVPCDLERTFPAEAGLQSYIGAPLRDARGRMSGHLAVFGLKPLVDPARAESLVSIFAMRAEAELGRIALEAERERLIADLVRLNEGLRARHARARAENTHKTALLGLIAHDLRRPLAAILAQAELGQALAGRGGAPERIGTALGKIAGQATRMAGVIESALARVRAEDEALTPVRMPFELRPLLRLVVEANREAAAAKGIALMLDPGPPIRIDADEELLLLALDNLVSNGIKYGSAGVTVRVSARIEDGAAVLAVADDGPGLGADDLARVFGRFATLSARPTGGESSTGLGLANVRAVAEAHGGSVSATSAGPGRGAVFAILLPPGTGATGAAAAGAPRD